MACRFRALRSNLCMGLAIAYLRMIMHSCSSTPHSPTASSHTRNFSNTELSWLSGERMMSFAVPIGVVR
jgi:hypothetical protein